MILLSKKANLVLFANGFLVTNNRPRCWDRSPKQCDIQDWAGEMLLIPSLTAARHFCC